MRCAMGEWGKASVGRVVIRAGTLVKGTGEAPSKKMAVIIEGSKIKAVAQASEVPEADGPGDIDVDLGEMTLLPGLIDVHTHLTFGTKGRKYEEVMRDDSDDLMLARSIRNAQTHMAAGITTLRDNGCRNRITLSTREIFQKGIFFGPRVLASARPITITGGHFWFCNGEADGVDEARKLARRLIKEGVDFIKIMGSGGGTAITDRRRHSFSQAELAAIMEEVHREGRLATIHCHASQAIRNAVSAGVDCIEHITFIEPDGQKVFDQAVADEILRKGIFVSPTIQVGYRNYEQLKAREPDLTPVERRNMEQLYETVLSRIENVGRMLAMGIRIVAGTDSIASFGDFAIGLELFVKGGMTPHQAIISATGEAARAIGVGDITGTVEVGKEADLVACERNPLDEISALNQPVVVIKGGKPFILPA